MISGIDSKAKNDFIKYATMVGMGAIFLLGVFFVARTYLIPAPPKDVARLFVLTAAGDRTNRFVNEFIRGNPHPTISQLNEAREHAQRLAALDVREQEEGKAALDMERSLEGGASQNVVHVSNMGGSIYGRSIGDVLMDNIGFLMMLVSSGIFLLVMRRR